MNLKKLSPLFVALAASSMTLSANANENYFDNWTLDSLTKDKIYLGVGYGIDMTKSKAGDFSFPTTSASSLSMRLGYDFNKYVAAELVGNMGLRDSETVCSMVIDDPNSEFTLDTGAPVVDDDGNETVGLGECDGYSRINLQYKYGANLKLSLPLNGYTSFIGKAGYSTSELEIKRYNLPNNGDLMGRVGIKDTGATFGGGLNFHIRNAGFIELSYESIYNKNKVQYNTFNLSYNHRF